jgi:BirA family biotin operon repressor/biotin-[acetyl-CoA-carboxylase] ligase
MTATPFDIARFNALLRTETFGRNFLFDASVGSTMDVAREAARAGAPEGTVAAADEQTAGRGRLNRSWLTPPAVNLASTLLLRPPPHPQREVAMIAPLAICGAAEDAAGVRADIKWPNDVQVDGKKLAGVLIETDLTDVRHPVALVGAGINVNFDPREYAEIRDIATSLRAVTGREIDREAMLAAYLLHFEQLYAAAVQGDSTLLRWRARLVTLGKQVHASWPGGSADGVAEDVDADGALLVRTGAGARVRVEAGDVTLRV